MLSIRNFNVWYGAQQMLRDICIDLPPGQITAIIGPSGCGKSTLLKGINRLLDLDEQARVSGRILLDGNDIYAPGVDVTEIRTRISLLAQKPFPLPLSIFDNVAYAPRLHGLVSRKDLPALVEASLCAARLWDEVKDRLHAPAYTLSVGQQQRLCLARALSVRPEVLLCDESTASLDPLSARGIEDLLVGLKGDYTVVMVTHDIAQARRLADNVVFLWLGEVVEQAAAICFFTQPQHTLTRAYLAHDIG